MNDAIESVPSPLRPSDFAVLLLSSGDVTPRSRARDQQADRAGLALKRRVLNALVTLDPEPQNLEAALLAIIDEFGPPFGPTRAISLALVEEWRAAVVTPEWLALLLGEAVRGPKAEGAGVADRFLPKWFGNLRTAPSSVDEARAECDQLAAARPDLLPLIQWLCAILPDLVPLRSAPTVPLEPERARAKLKEGIPLLRGERMGTDGKAFRQRWKRACAALEAQQADGAAAALAVAVRYGLLDPDALLQAVIAGKPAVVQERAEESGLDPGLATTLLRFTLFPLMTAVAASLRPLHDGVVWDHGYCPTCGSWPLLGEFRGLEQARFLRCGLCASEWEAPRLWCPFCGNRDHDQLGFLQSEGEDAKYRAAVCAVCRGYVKTVSTLSALQPLQLLVTDAATLHLDLAAAERGYTNHF